MLETVTAHLRRLIYGQTLNYPAYRGGASIGAWQLPEGMDIRAGKAAVMTHMLQTTCTQHRNIPPTGTVQTKYRPISVCKKPIMTIRIMCTIRWAYRLILWDHIEYLRAWRFQEWNERSLCFRLPVFFSRFFFSFIFSSFIFFLPSGTYFGHANLEGVRGDRIGWR